MNGSKFTCGTMKGFSRILDVRRLLTIFFIVVLVCSLQIASFHHHDSITVHRDCPICKFLAIFSSDSEAAAQLMIAPDSMHLFSAIENLLTFFEALAVVPDTRAPPYSSFQARSRNYFRINNYLQSR